MSGQKSAVLLLAHGSPDSPADVPEFMKYITGGRPVPDSVIQEIAHRYSLIGKSPLTKITMQQAEGLKNQLKLPVYVGMRNWKPFIAEAVRQMTDQGIDLVVAICLAPQNSSTSVGLYRKALLAELKPGTSMHFVESWHDHPLLVQAFAERLEPVWQRASNEVGELVPGIFVAGLAPELLHFAFQSQGMSGGPWLGPTVESAMLELKRQGHQGVVIAPVGFVCDHVEVLYDIDIGFREFASEQGLRMWRPESLNDSATFIAALARLASTELARASGIISLV